MHSALYFIYVECKLLVWVIADSATVALEHVHSI